MPDTAQKNKLFFDFYQNIKNGTEILSIEDLELAIKTIELAKEELKKREQHRIQKAELEAHKNNTYQGEVLCLPKKLRYLDGEAFKNNKKIVKVVLNEGLTNIGEYAFEGCTNLKEVVFPKNRVILRRGCFKDCSSLKSIFINSVANINPGAFENCISLESVFLPSDISNVYSGAFRNCRSLKTVAFEEKGRFNSVSTLIFPRVFENCVSLESIEFTKGTAIDVESFVNCSRLKKIYVHDNWLFKRKFKGCNAKVIKI